MGVFPTLEALTSIPITYVGASCTAVVITDGIANTYMPSGGQFVIKHYRQLPDGTLVMSGPVQAPEFVTASTPVPVTMTGAQLAAAMVAGQHIQLGPGHHTITGQASVVSPTTGFKLTGAGKDKTFLHFDTGAPISIFAAATDWSISDLTLVSDVSSSVLTYLGIITTWDVVDNWKIERVGFTSPDNNENAIKMMTSSGGHIRNVSVVDCKFYDIANMGIEIWGDTALDVTNIELMRCSFEDVSSVAGLPVSFVAANQHAVRVVDCVLDSCYAGIEVASGVHVDNVEFRYTRRDFNPIMASGSICDSVISNCRDQTIFGIERSGTWQLYCKRLRISNCVMNSSLYLRGAEIDISGSVFRWIDCDTAPSKINMNGCTLGVHGAAPFAFYVNETATGSVAQGYGNRFKTTAVTNDAGRITTTGLVGTLLGYGI